MGSISKVIDTTTEAIAADYSYDAAGNRLATHLSALYSSNDHNQLVEDAEYTYAYDDKGNRTSKTSKADGSIETYTYHAQNRLIGYTSDTTTATYAYDALERWIAKTVDGVTTAYVYDTSTNAPLAHDDILLEFSGGTLTRRWLHSDSVDEPVGFEDVGGSTYDLYADRVGSISKVVDSTTGAITAEYSYDSYGTLITHAASLFQHYCYTARRSGP
jgi:YD repeat-containing protein